MKIPVTVGQCIHLSLFDFSETSHNFSRAYLLTNIAVGPRGSGHYAGRDLEARPLSKGLLVLCVAGGIKERPLGTLDTSLLTFEISIAAAAAAARTLLNKV